VGHLSQPSSHRVVAVPAEQVEGPGSFSVASTAAPGGPPLTRVHFFMEAGLSRGSSSKAFNCTRRSPFTQFCKARGLFRRVLAQAGEEKRVPLEGGLAI